MRSLIRAILAREVLVVAGGVAIALAFVGFARAVAATIVDVVDRPYPSGWVDYPADAEDTHFFGFPQSVEVGGRLIFYGDLLKHGVALLLTLLVAALLLRRGRA